MNVFDAAWIIADQLQMRMGHGEPYAEIVAVEMPGDKAATKEDKSFRVTFDLGGDNCADDYVTFTVTVE